jgi:midasin
MEEGENDNKPDELDEMGDSKDQDVDADDAVPAPDPNDAQPPAQEEDAPALDQSLGGTDQGDTGGEGAQDNAASSKPETSTADASEQSGAQAEAEVDPTPDSAMEDPENGLPEDRDDNDDASADPSPSAPSKSADGQSKQRSSTSDPKSDPSRSRPEQPSPSEPQRSLGDALQSWRRRLEAISDLQESEATNPDIDATAAGQEDEVEFVQDGDEQEQDGQALGPATEDQVQGLESLRLGEEDETQNGFEPDEMDVDDTTPTLPPPTSTIKLEGSSLAESDVKAIPAAELQEERTAVELDQDDDDLMRDDDEEIPSSTFADVGDDTPDDAEVEQALIDWRSGDDATLTAGDVWRKYEALTRDLSYALTEQLRLILEPTLATRLKGDYRSGKRLNMRKIIP